MEYKYLKEQLLSMFDSDKLHLFPEEWGFFNETERDIKRIGYATNPVSYTHLDVYKRQDRCRVP